MVEIIRQFNAEERETIKDVFLPILKDLKQKNHFFASDVYDRIRKSGIEITESIRKLWRRFLATMVRIGKLRLERTAYRSSKRYILFHDVELKLRRYVRKTISWIHDRIKSLWERRTGLDERKRLHAYMLRHPDLDARPENRLLLAAAKMRS